MKKIIITSLIVVISGLFVFAQEKTPVKKATPTKAETAPATTPVAQEPNPNAPVIKFDKKVHDFGEIEYGGDGNCKFIFKNEGKEALVISNAKASCGCTVPKWPKQPIAPGQTDTVNVRYNTKRAGNFTKTITIYSNSSTPQERLTIKGKVGPNPAAAAKPTSTSTSAPANTSPVKKPTGPVSTGTKSN